MERSKSYAVMFLLGAFITGGALGFAADRVMSGERHREGRTSGGYRQRLAHQLDLNAQQQASIDSLIEQKHTQIVALYRPVKPQLDSLAVAARVISDSTNAQIKRLLSPNQQEKFEKMRDAGRHDLARRRGKDSDGRPPGKP
jgi:Spy/CpxP family protein refolding chaperone